ncbi:MAG: zinc metallopeptidase [Lachnospiraceae bacterium]|nr:zinc metallopeptidase [Lachnospiraceae bacterium]
MYYGGYGIGYGFFDPTYLLVLVGIVICAIASWNVKATFSRYKQVRSRLGMTGAQAAEQVLHNAGIFDVRVQHVSGNLTDHYDPRSKTVNLSDSVYGSTSVAAIGVAAHECGHAIQHAKHYAPLDFRTWLVPVANFGSAISWPMILIGLFLGYGSSYTAGNSIAGTLIMIGIWAFAASVLFQIVTLPVEFNASHRALIMLRDGHMLDDGELVHTRKVLVAAALTYVAGALSAILQLFRIILITQGRDRD